MQAVCILSFHLPCTPWKRIVNTPNPIVCCIPLFLVVLLSACAPLQDAVNPYEENFKCKSKDDAGECIDTTAAYKKARYPDADPEPDRELANGITKEVQDNRYRVLAGLLKEEKKPLLQPPKILRVLLLPYKGEEDELFMSRYVYVKIEDSKWILTDLAEE